MARIFINHLASIRELEMDIKQINIFIGEQATGKSTLCKAVYFFRNFKEILLDYYYAVGQYGKKEKGLIKTLNSKLKDSFVSLFGYSWKLPADLSMKYCYTDDNYIQINLVHGQKKYISLQYSAALKKELQQLEEYALHFFNSTGTLNESSLLSLLENRNFYDYLDKEVSRMLDDDMTTYYIPAGRGLLSLLCNQKTYLNYKELDPINRKFMQTIETLQPKFADGVSCVHKYYRIDERKFDINTIVKDIIHGMKGEYFYQQGREYLQIENGNEEVAINFASSGQQEALWLYNQLYVLLLKNEKSFIIIEEPEAHLYPTLQKNLLDFITKYLNITESVAIITTHSPYMLMEMNNLYIAGRLKKDSNKQKKVEKLVGKWAYIQDLALNAFKLDNSKEGTKIQSLIDEQTGEVLAEKIDEISEEINQMYTALFYLEEGITDEEN